MSTLLSNKPSNLLESPLQASCESPYINEANSNPQLKVRRVLQIIPQQHSSNSPSLLKITKATSSTHYCQVAAAADSKSESTRTLPPSDHCDKQ